jgi:hypothetical protein
MQNSRSHISDYEEFCLLGYNAVYSAKNQTEVSEEHVTFFFRVEVWAKQ